MFEFKYFNTLRFFQTEALLPALPLKTPELADKETSLVNKPLVRLLEEVLKKAFNLIT